jgi:hypothetical protein
MGNTVIEADTPLSHESVASFYFFGLRIRRREGKIASPNKVGFK